MDLKERKSGFRLEDIKFRITGKKSTVETEIIHGKKLTVVFTFFNKANYDAEFRDWIDFQSRAFKGREASQKVEGFKIYQGITGRGNISYDEFIRITVPFVSRIMFQVFQDNPSLFSDDDETVIHIKVQRCERWELDESSREFIFNGAFPYSDPEYFVKKATEDGLLDLSRFFFIFSGFYFLQAIVAPHLFLGRIDYNFFYKYLAHEIEHYRGCALGNYTPEIQMMKRLGPHMALKVDYSLYYLTAALSDLRNEAVADFRKKRNTPRILIVPRIIRNFRNILNELLMIKKKNIMHDYYDDKIGVGSMEGLYYCGYIMSFFIAYSLDLKTPKLVRDGKFNQDLKNLQEAFREDKQFYITQPSDKSYAQTLSLIDQADYVHFLRLYDQACDKLGLDDDSRVLTVRMFTEMWRRAESVFQNQELEAIKKAGYYPKI